MTWRITGGTGTGDDTLYSIAGAPALDLRFASTKSLTDHISGRNLVTFSRASDGATFVDSDGLVKRAATNFIRNNTMVGAVAGTPGTLPTNWSQANNTGLVANVVGTGTENGIAYMDVRLNGTTTGTGQTNVTLQAALNTPALTGQTWTLSSYLKVQGGSLANITSINLVIQENTSGGVAVTATAQATAIPSTSLGSYRAVFTRTNNGGVTVADIMPYIQININTGLAVDLTLRIGLPQLEQGSSATSPILTTGTINSAPRFDHNPLTGACLGLLMEEQRANLLVRSEEFDNASWVKSSTTVSANAITSPAGTLTADKLEETSANTFFALATNPTAATSTTYTYSIYAKAGERNGLKINFTNVGSCSFNIATGTVTASDVGITGSSVISMGNGWFRCSLTFTTPSSGSNLLYNLTQILNNGVDSYQGVAGSGIYLWGAQLEAGAFPTSYIPTTGTSATRSADIATIGGTNFSSWYNQAQGSVFCDANEFPVATPGASRGFYSFNASSDPNNNYVRQWIWNGATNLILNSVYTSSSGPIAAEFNTTFSTAAKKIALALNANNFARSYNAGAAVTDSIGNMPVAIDQLIIGQLVAGVGPLNGTISRLTYWPRRLPGATLQALTA